MTDATGTTYARVGAHFRAEPDDGRRFTFDPAGAEDGDRSADLPPWRDDPTPWRVDAGGPPVWVARESLPAVLVPVTRDEFLAWLATL